MSGRGRKGAPVENRAAGAWFSTGGRLEAVRGTWEDLVGVRGGGVEVVGGRCRANEQEGREGAPHPRPSRWGREGSLGSGGERR
jgi:hypothetical protein